MKTEREEALQAAEAAEAATTNGTEKAQAPQACFEAIQDVLAEHNCIIVPYILPPEGVGKGTSKVLITAGWGVQEKV